MCVVPSLDRETKQLQDSNCFHGWLLVIINVKAEKNDVLVFKTSGEIFLLYGDIACQQWLINIKHEVEVMLNRQKMTRK